MSQPTMRDHVRPTGGDYADAVYRVVGRDDGTVTLLAVTDGDGRRASTGRVVRVAREEFARFEPAENPDGTRRRTAVVRSAVESSYWSFRVFGRQLVAHPLATALVGAVMLAGTVGESALGLSDGVAGALVIAGSLGLAYVGSGRL